MLPVELYGRHIADLHRGARGLEIDWSPSRGRLRGAIEVSANLPTGIDASAAAVESFFGGLLPEGPWLNRLADEVGVVHTDVYGLLEHVGGDLAGALRIGPGCAARPPRRLDADELPRLLEQAGGYVLGGGGSALPGFQRKLALTRMSGEWWLGGGSLPSTHILKPSTELSSRITDAEDYLLGLSRALGLTTFASWTERIGELAVVVVERYDRIVTDDDRPAERIHQEDAAQALGLPWLSDAKFQRADARASLASIAGLLDAQRTIFDTDEPQRARLLRYATFNLAVGNTDAHAKNFSILRPDGAPARLAPLYDLVPLAVLTEARLGLPLFINGKRMSNEVTIDDLVTEATTWGLAADLARRVAVDTLESLVEATRQVPAAPSIGALLPGFVRTQSLSLLDGRPARLEGAIPAYFRTEIGTPGPTGEGPARRE